MHRRDSLKVVALSGIAMTTLGAWVKEVKAEAKDLIILTDEREPKPLPFDPKKLTGISEKLITSHWENNYGSAVTALNSVNKKLKEAFSKKDTPPFIIGGLKRDQLNKTGSIVNHDLYFENLGGDGKLDGEVKQIITTIFSSEANWVDVFKRTGESLSGGSGWVVMAYNYHLKTLENYWCYDHMHAPSGTFPLLVMDMYEHAYQMDYGAEAAQYIDAFFKNINWGVVNRRLEKIRKII